MRYAPTVCGNTYWHGKTLPRFGGTFSQVGKPCRVTGKHFPRRGNLAAFRENIFPGGKTLPRSRGTFSQAGKPCRATGEHFPERGNLAAFQGNIFPSGETLPQSFPVRSRQGVCDTPLQFLRETFHDLFLFAHFKEYAIRPYTYSIIIKALSSENIMPN